MTPQQIKDGYEKKIEQVRKMDLEPEMKALMISALEKKGKDEVRALEMKVTRAQDRVDLQYWSNGCPKCNHQFPKDERERKVKDYLEFREVSNRQ